jgi:hypothetical protein
MTLKGVPAQSKKKAQQMADKGLDAEELSPAQMRRKAGHQEILGETLAKFEFFQHGWHPYTRFLDIEKIDLILRRRRNGKAEYREIQVKFGKLFTCTQRWEKPLFSVSSWRFFKEKALADLSEYPGLFLAYVLAPDDGFKGDVFILPVKTFVDLIRRSDKLGNGDYRVCISRSHEKEPHWYLRRRSGFDKLDRDSVIDVTEHYRNFGCLG